MVPQSRRGILLIAHGTRSEAGRRQFLDVTAELASLAPNNSIEPALLELAQPDIQSAIAGLADRGVSTIVAVPLLLFSAGHMQRDIPDLVTAAVARLPERPTCLEAEHLGCHQDIVELSQLRFREAVGPRPGLPASNTCLLLVGRGSHEESATAEMRRFAEMRADPSSAAQTRVAFLAMAQPSLAEELQRIADQGFRRVVVEPHLLFEGELMASIRTQVEAIGGQHPEQDWLTTAGLADPPGVPASGTRRLAKAAFDRFRAATRVVAAGADD